MNIDSWNKALIAEVCSNIVPHNPTKIQSLQAIQDYNSLKSVSIKFNSAMKSEYCIEIFIQIIWTKTFGSRSCPKDVKSWENYLKSGFRVLRNWINDTPQHRNMFITGGKFQSVRKNDGVELMNYDFTSKTLSRVRIETDSTSNQKLELDGEVNSPGKICYPFIAQTDELLAINEGESNVKIFIQHNGKIFALLENLGKVKQIEMFEDFLFILQQSEEGSNLLRFDTRHLYLPGRTLKSPDILSLSSKEDIKNERVNKHVNHFFLSENRISILSVFGINLQLRTLCLSPLSNFPVENKDLKWVSLITFPTSSNIARDGENFIICELNGFKLKRLVAENCFKIEEIVKSIPISSPATEIVELYCNSGKVFIFYYSKKSSKHNVVTFDTETNQCSNSADFPCISSLKPYHPSFAWHTTAEKTNFMYFHLQPIDAQENKEQSGIMIIDYK